MQSTQVGSIAQSLEIHIRIQQNNFIEDMVTSVLYFLHLNTLDIILLIVNISFADDAFYK